MQILGRIRNILFSPSNEWIVIKEEKTSIKKLFLKYALILAIIPSLASLIGFMLFGVYLKRTRFEVPAERAVLWSVLSYVLNIITVLLSGYVIDAFSRTFRCKKNLNASMKVIVYSLTPVWLGGIFYIIPSLNFLIAVGWIYFLILMYSGLRFIKDVPGERIAGYEILVFSVMIIFYYFTTLILTGLSFGSLLAA